MLANVDKNRKMLVTEEKCKKMLINVGIVGKCRKK